MAFRESQCGSDTYKAALEAENERVTLLVGAYQQADRLAWCNDHDAALSAFRALGAAGFSPTSLIFNRTVVKILSLERCKGAKGAKGEKVVIPGGKKAWRNQPENLYEKTVQTLEVQTESAQK